MAEFDTLSIHLGELWRSRDRASTLRLQHLKGILKEYLPEVDALYGIPQREEFHPEIDTGWHMELVLRQTEMFDDPSVFIAALLHDLGKGVTPVEILPRHNNHDSAGIPLVAEVCERLKIPPTIKRLALTVCEQHIRLHSIFDQQPSTIVKTYDEVFKSEEPLFWENFVKACQCDVFGRLGMDNRIFFHEGFFFLSVMKELKAWQDNIDKVGTKLREQDLHRERLTLVREHRDKYKTVFL